MHEYFIDNFCGLFFHLDSFVSANIIEGRQGNETVNYTVVLRIGDCSHTVTTTEKNKLESFKDYCKQWDWIWVHESRIINLFNVNFIEYHFHEEGSAARFVFHCRDNYREQYSFDRMNPHTYQDMVAELKERYRNACRVKGGGHRRVTLLKPPPQPDDKAEEGQE